MRKTVGAGKREWRMKGSDTRPNNVKRMAVQRHKDKRENE